MKSSAPANIKTSIRQSSLLSLIGIGFLRVYLLIRLGGSDQADESLCYVHVICVMTQRLFGFCDAHTSPVIVLPMSRLKIF